MNMLFYQKYSLKVMKNTNVNVILEKVSQGD